MYTVNPVTKVKRLPDSYHQRLIGRLPREMSAETAMIAEYALELAGLNEATDPSVEIDYPLPQWLGDVKSFENELIGAYERLETGLDTLRGLYPVRVPSVPSRVNGWSTWVDGKWVEMSADVRRVFLSKNTMVIDAETVKVDDNDWRPVCLVALDSLGRWSMWRVDSSLELEQLPRLIDFGIKNVYVGHNANYDTALIEQECRHQPSGSLAFCTMGAHMITRGVSNQQRPLLNIDPMDTETVIPYWVSETAKSGLDSVYQLHFGIELDKGVRDSIINGGWHWVRDNLDEVSRYCMHDVLATLRVFSVVYPEFCYHVPDRVMRYGIMHQYSMYVPLSSERQPGFYDRVQAAYDEQLADIGRRIIEAAMVILLDVGQRLAWEQCPINEAHPFYVYREKTTKQRKTKKTPNPETVIERYRLTWVDEVPPEDSIDWIRYRGLNWTLVKSQKYGVVPVWFADIMDNPTAGKSSTPIILGVTWLDSPVRWVNNPEWQSNGGIHGWCYLTEEGQLRQIPSPEKAGKPVSEMFVKGFMKDEETITPALGTHDGRNSDLLMQVMSCSLWRSFRKRVRSMRVVDVAGYPVAKPIISRTVSGRCIDLWQLMPNTKASRLGSGIRSLIEAPKGYRLVKADLSSQELRAFSNLGDAHHGYYGSTALGKANLVGNSKDKTDPHSLLQVAADITRTLAKNVNYGCIYGLAERGVSDYLQKANPSLLRAVADSMAKNILSKLQGVKSYNTGLYMNGMASDAFNAVMRVYKSAQPATPYGGFRMSRAMVKAGWSRYQTTFQNWVIQATGSVITTKLLAYTMHIFRQMSIPARLVLTIHDEFVYLVREEYAEAVVYAMQLAHLLLSADITLQLGLDCLPLNYAFFDGIEVDTIYRKSPSDQPRTPDQPDIYIEPGREYSTTDAAEIGRRLLTV